MRCLSASPARLRVRLACVDGLGGSVRGAERRRAAEALSARDCGHHALLRFSVWIIVAVAAARCRSKIAEILKKPSFALVELLAEDELLQEVAGRNDKLLKLYVLLWWSISLCCPV